MMTDMDEKGLTEYFKLDLNEEMMRKDVKQLGFTMIDY